MRNLRRIGLGLAGLYTILLLAELILITRWHDTQRWLFVLNALAVYTFVPLPLAALVVWRWRGSAALSALVVAVGVWGSVEYGGLLLPPPLVVNGGATLTLMTFNLDIDNHDDRTLGLISGSGADVVAMQELNPVMAQRVVDSLSEVYPYQMLAPREGGSGMGILSKYPLTLLDTPFETTWFSDPQLVEINFGGRAVRVLNFHYPPFRTGDKDGYAQAIAAYAHAEDAPLLVAGDFNATEGGVTYLMLTGSLLDTWREVGWGLGHTYPAKSPEYFSPLGRETWMPRWVVRIDYVFHSTHWQLVSARVGASGGGSDHRPVIVTLGLTSG